MVVSIGSAKEVDLMEKQANLGGVFTLARTSLTLNRIGYGALRLPGPEVWGPPKDRYAALALLKEAIVASHASLRIRLSDFAGLTACFNLLPRALTPPWFPRA